MTVGVIGAGNWGRNLVDTFHDLGALGSVADLDPEVRTGVKDAYPDVAVFEDHKALLSSDVPAVAVATPVKTHHDIVRAGLEAGKDVFVEKPLSLSTDRARELAELAEEQGRILMVGHLLVYQPAIHWISEALQDGLIGNLLSLHQERLNLGTARAHENALWSLGVHDVAVLLHLVGEHPERVRCTGHPMLQPGIEDDIHLHLWFPGNVRAHLHSSWMWPEKDRTLTLVGTEGMLVYDEIAQHVTLHRKRIDDDLQEHDDGSEVVFEGDEEPLARELDQFLKSLRTRDPPPSDARQGVEVVRILEEADGRIEP